MENGCTNLSQVARSVRLLKIDGFSLIQGMGCLKSRWNVDGYEWEIRIYSDYTWSVDATLVFLSEARTPGGARANLACQVVDPSGELEPFKEGAVSKTFHRAGEIEGFDFRNRTTIASGYLKDDSLTLQCAITVLKELPVVPTIQDEEVITLPSTNLHQHLGELLQSEAGADVTFLVGDGSFAAHKNILAARSPVFKAQFFGDMKEKSSRHVQVQVQDMDAAAFKAMLHFIYTDTVSELDQGLEVVAMMAQHLLAAADRYGLHRLKLICEIKLSGGITVDTAATTLALAEQHSSPQLKAKCVDFIVSTPAVLDAVLATEGYKHLEASCPSVLAELLKRARGRKN